MNGNRYLSTLNILTLNWKLWCTLWLAIVNTSILLHVCLFYGFELEVNIKILLYIIGDYSIVKFGK